MLTSELRYIAATNQGLQGQIESESFFEDARTCSIRKNEPSQVSLLSFLGSQAHRHCKNLFGVEACVRYRSLRLWKFNCYNERVLNADSSCSCPRTVASNVFRSV